MKQLIFIFPNNVNIKKNFKKEKQSKTKSKTLIQAVFMESILSFKKFLDTIPIGIEAEFPNNCFIRINIKKTLFPNTFTISVGFIDHFIATYDLIT